MRREHPDHFITRLRNYSYSNCKRAYYFHKAGLTLTEVGKRIDPELGSYKPPSVREMIEAFGESLAFEAQVELRRKELLRARHNSDDSHRELDSFANEVITRSGKGSGCWYASLDSRGDKYCSTDFATGAGSREDAIRFCSLKIRLDHIGIGKYAPHNCLQGYNFHYGLAEFWVKKETQRKYRHRVQSA